MSNVFAGLMDFTTILLVVGIVVGLAAYLAGRPAWLDRLGERLRTGGAEPWVRAHLNGLRFAGVVVVLAALLLMDLSLTGVIVVLVLLGAYELGVSSLAGLRSAPADVPD
jgi:uncharacterized membrane protein YqhA